MNFISIFIVAYVGAITPGPDILLVLHNTLRFGFLQGLKVFSGIASGWVIFLCFIYFGFIHVLSGYIAQSIIGVVGGLYLIYISYLLFKKQDSKMEFNENIEYMPDTYLKALFINLSNPKAILFFSTIIVPFIEDNLVVNIFVLFCALCSAFLSVIILAVFFRNLLNKQIFYMIDKLCSIIFFIFAIMLLYHSLSIIYNLYD